MFTTTALFVTSGAEEFVHKFGSISNLRDRLMCWRFGSKFEKLCVELEVRMERILKATHVLRNNEALKQVMGPNEGHSKGVASGGVCIFDPI